MKMTRAEYLKARGWSSRDVTDLRGGPWIIWRDPRALFAPDGTAAEIPQSEAITAQLARDAEEERRAWDRYFSDEASAVRPDGDWMLSDKQARDQADRMLEMRRAKFAVEFTD